MNEATSNWTPDSPLWDSFQPVQPPPLRPHAALSFRRRWTTSVDNLVSKGLMTSVCTPPTRSPPWAQPHSTASDELPTQPLNGILTHPTGLRRGQSLPSALGV